MNKSTIVALLVFIGLAVAAAFTLRQPPERGITRISLADVKPDRITRVVIESPDKIELSKDGAAWKLDGKPGEPRHMRMTGYPSKVKSYSWSPKGKWLATSGAPAAIVWPFSAKDGPMGKAPLELGTRANIMVTCVAFHPAEEVLAIGYIDGMVLGVRVGDGKEALLRRPGNGAITAMSWSANGKLLAFGSEAGDCGVIDIAA